MCERKRSKNFLTRQVVGDVRKSLLYCLAKRAMKQPLLSRKVRASTVEDGTTFIEASNDSKRPD